MAYCARCDRNFPNDRALTQHRYNSNLHIICRSCDRDFNTVEARRQHYINSPNHHYCVKCGDHFNDDDDLHEHYKEEHNWCRRCGRFFDDSYDLASHIDEIHHYCDPCDRFFDSASNLEAHRRSAIHSDRDHHCPANGCEKAFLNDGDLVAHWEMGACSSGVDRQRVNEAFVAVDSSDFTDSDFLRVDSDGDFVAPLPSKERVPERLWNGNAWECNRCNRTFNSRDVLRTHLRGPAHALRFYRCAESYDGCNAHFSTLSALLKHAESETCGVELWVLGRRLEYTQDNLF